MKIIKFTEISNKLRADWEALWKNSSCANLVNSPAWTLAAEKTYSYKDLLIIAVYDDQEANMQAIAIFVKEKMFGISLWTVPVIEFADRCTMLANLNDEDVMRFLLSEIAKLGIVYLPYCTQDEMIKMREYIPASKKFKSEVNLYIDFSKGKYGKYSKKRNNLLNRSENMKMRLDIFTEVNANYSKALEVCFDIDKASVKQSKGKGVFYKNYAREFYKKLSKLSSGNMSITILYLNDKPISYEIGFLARDVYTSEQKAFLEGFEYYNPGKLIVIKLIDYYYEKGFAVMEFGRGCDRSKRDFTSNYHMLYGVIISKNIPLKLYIMAMHDLRTEVYKFVSSHAKLYCFYKKVKEAIP